MLCCQVWPGQLPVSCQRHRNRGRITRLNHSQWGKPGSWRDSLHDSLETLHWMRSFNPESKCVFFDHFAITFACQGEGLEMCVFWKALPVFHVFLANLPSKPRVRTDNSIIFRYRRQWSKPWCHRFGQIVKINQSRKFDVGLNVVTDVDVKKVKDVTLRSLQQCFYRQIWKTDWLDGIKIGARGTDEQSNDERASTRDDGINHEVFWLHKGNHWTTNNDFWDNFVDVETKQWYIFDFRLKFWQKIWKISIECICVKKSWR